jgi:Putative peptidoglycan binding domain
MLNEFFEENEAVRNWQLHLNNEGLDVAVTGIFDAQTEAATKEFQSANNLKTDGVAGPKTLGLVNKINMAQKIEIAKNKKAEEFLILLAEKGGKIVSSNNCSLIEIAEAQADEKRWHVNEDGYGFVYFPDPEND